MAWPVLKITGWCNDLLMKWLVNEMTRCWNESVDETTSSQNK